MLYSPNNANEAAEMDLQASPEGLMFYPEENANIYVSPASNCLNVNINVNKPLQIS
jgi:hypothetical protein